MNRVRMSYPSSNHALSCRTIVLELVWERDNQYSCSPIFGMLLPKELNLDIFKSLTYFIWVPVHLSDDILKSNAAQNVFSIFSIFSYMFVYIEVCRGTGNPIRTTKFPFFKISQTHAWKMTPFSSFREFAPPIEKCPAFIYFHLFAPHVWIVMHICIWALTTLEVIKKIRRT